MCEARDNTQRSSFEPSTALILIAEDTRDDRMPDPESAKELAYRLVRHALFTAFLATQLSMFPLRLLLRLLTPSLHQLSQRSLMVRNLLKRRDSLPCAWLRWPLVSFVVLAWPQVVALQDKVDRLTLLLEENIELMTISPTRAEKTKPLNVSQDAGLSNDESIISPITASAIYHAALANNKDLDSLLDMFDGGKASTLSYTSWVQQDDSPTRYVTGFEERTSSSLQPTRSLDAQRSARLDISSSTLNSQQSHGMQSPPLESPSILKQIQTAPLRHRSPVPSMSTTTPRSSPSSTGSITSRKIHQARELNETSRGQAVAEMQPRCTACNEGHSQIEQAQDSKEEATTIQEAPISGNVRQGRQSAIPRRTGRSLLNQRAKIPL